MYIFQFIFFFFSQGGIYVFQLIEAYGTTRMSNSFLAISECLAVGWIYGKYT